jgi:hypothetical protein
MMKLIINVVPKKVGKPGWFILFMLFSWLGLGDMSWGQSAPVISSISPTSVVEGSGDFTLTVRGSGFSGGISGTGIVWAQVNLATTVVSDTLATAIVPASYITYPGTYSIWFHLNLAGANFSSNNVNFLVLAQLDSISPSFRPAGSASFTLTVNGDFSSFEVAAVTWNGKQYTTTRISSTQLSAVIPASELATAGDASVRVVDIYSSLTSTALSFTIDPPLSLSQLTPSRAVVGSPDLTLSASGAGFRPEYFTTLQWNGVNLATTVVNTTQLTAVAPAANLAQVGSATVTAINPRLKASSNDLIFHITPPPPTITSLLPADAVAGTGAFTLTVNGTNFLAPVVSANGSMAGSTVQWNGADRPTTFVSANQLTAAIPATDLVDAGLIPVTVSNEAQFAGVSAPATFAVNNPIPAILSLDPSSRPAGAGGFVLTVNGAKFGRGAVVRWNGNNRTTAYSSASQLTVQIDTKDIAAEGVAEVTVFNPAPGGGSSAPAVFNITPPLKITSPASLPNSLVGVHYSSQLMASGGQAPYSWRIVEGALPTGFTLDTTGVISGTPNLEGKFTVQISVTDALQSTVSHLFTLTVHAALSNVNLTGIPEVPQFAQQIGVGLTLSAPYLLDLEGQLTLTFTPDAVFNADDPSIQFVTGGRTVSFTIPANTTSAIFSNNSDSVAFQTGTVAGTIEVGVTMQLDGSNFVPSPDPSRTLVLPRLPPTLISAAIVNKTANSFEIDITGYSNSRSLGLVKFYLYGKPGGNLQTQALSSDVSSLFSAWYQSPDSAQFGSQFKLVVPFTVNGNINDIVSIVVSLFSDEGYSDAISLDFASGTGTVLSSGSATASSFQ